MTEPSGRPGRDRPAASGDPKSPPGGTRRARSTQRPAERSRTADPARRAAYTVLRAVAAGAYANLELPTVLQARHIRGRDAAFATELTYGAIRLRGRYDPVIAVAAGRPLAAIDEAVLDTLRLGAHQVLGMRVPKHAAVAETVALARQVNGAGAAGFVNAVLRRVSERSLSDWMDAVAPASLDLVERLTVRESHPRWIVTALRAALIGHGRATPDTIDEELAALVAADNEPARVALAARPGLATVRELLDAGAEPGRFAETAAVLPSGDPGSVAAVREGRAAVQDEGSQLVALATAALPLVGRQSGQHPGGPLGGPLGGQHPGGGRQTSDTERWLDLCAGPGGKAGILAGLALVRGAWLVANEVSPHRAELVRHTLATAVAKGAAGQITVRVGDGRAVGADERDSYDRVLLDAPCTGLGALRRRPEARWRRSPGDVADLARLQRELLASALDATRPGGVVAYATCSPHLNETRFVVADVVRRRADAQVLDVRPYFRDAAGAPIASLGDGPHVQLWPHVHSTDGMYVAAIRRL